jgi:hypothetical protein
MSHKKYRDEKVCLNCGATVERKFCPECGQENLELNENFFHIAFHTVGDFFHYDSMFFRSIIPLFTKPGFLTKEYWNGRRVRYIHPVRMFFFVTIIFMIVTSIFYRHFKDKIIITETTTEITNPFKRKIDKYAPSVEFTEDNLVKDMAYKGMDKFFAYLKYISFFMLPIYALIFQVLYRREKSLYVNHLVYVLHLQSFAYILISLSLLIPFQFPDSIAIVRRVTLLVVLIYMTFSLRTLYHQAWPKTILKAFIATLSMVTLMALVLILFIVIHIIKYST